jgi:hypothetical protein
MDLTTEVLIWVGSIVLAGIFCWGLVSCLEFPGITYLKQRDKLQIKLKTLQIKQQKLEQEKKLTQEELNDLDNYFNEYLEYFETKDRRKKS